MTTVRERWCGEQGRSDGRRSQKTQKEKEEYEEQKRKIQEEEEGKKKTEWEMKQEIKNEETNDEKRGGKTLNKQHYYGLIATLTIALLRPQPQ